VSLAIWDHTGATENAGLELNGISGLLLESGPGGTGTRDL